MAASVSCVPSGIRQSFAAIFKLTVIKHAEKMRNCNAAKMFRAVEADKCELYLKISQWAQAWHFQQFAQGLVEFVHVNRKT
jgi:hypothetical protein